MSGWSGALRDVLSRRWAIPALAVVLLVVIGGVAFLLRPDDGRGTSAAPVPPVPPVLTATATATPEAPTTSKATEEPGANETAAVPTEPAPRTVEPPPVEFTCWNGDTVLDLGECARPRKDSQVFRYLRYVYPGVADLGEECGQKPTPKQYSDLAAYLNCPAEGVHNIRYRYWGDADEAAAHYGRDNKRFDGGEPYDVYIGDQRVDGWVLMYNVPENGLLTATMLLPDHHLSISIEGKSEKALWTAFGQITIRPVEEILGYPSADGPSMTLLSRG